MPNLFEQIGSWVGAKEHKPEHTAQEFVDFYEDVAVIKPDTPEELKQKAIALAGFKGFTVPVPSVGAKGLEFCRLADFDRLAVTRGLIRYLSDNLALINPDIPEEHKSQFVGLANGKGFTEPLPWRGIKGQLLCRQADYANLAKAQEVGDSSMSFKRSLIDEGLISELERNFDGYVLDKPLASLPDAQHQPYIVLVKKTEGR